MASLQDPKKLMESFEVLLSEHKALVTTNCHKEHREGRERLAQFSDLLAGYKVAFENYRREQVGRADDFNILEALDLTNDEVRHSMLLAWLLDPDIKEFGTHAQGSLGFRLFLEEVGLPKEYAQFPYAVSREVSGEQSRVDIRIESERKFSIDIENKIWASEGDDQTNREWLDLQHHRKKAGTDVALHAFFLTPDGSKPNNKNFRPISWGQMASVFEQFSALAKPRNVKLFASQYAAALRKFIVRKRATESLEDENEIL